MMARLTTMRWPRPAPGKTRAAISCGRFSAKMQPIAGHDHELSPASSTGRRPNLSDSAQ